MNHKSSSVLEIIKIKKKLLFFLAPEKCQADVIFYLYVCTGWGRGGARRFDFRARLWLLLVYVC